MRSHLALHPRLTIANTDSFHQVCYYRVDAISITLPPIEFPCTHYIYFHRVIRDSVPLLCKQPGRTPCTPIWLVTTPNPSSTTALHALRISVDILTLSVWGLPCMYAALISMMFALHVCCPYLCDVCSTCVIPPMYVLCVLFCFVLLCFVVNVSPLSPIRCTCRCTALLFAFCP